MTDDADLAQIRLVMAALFFAAGIVAGNRGTLAADVTGALAAADALLAAAGVKAP